MPKKKRRGLTGANFKKKSGNNDRWTQGRSAKRKVEKEIRTTKLSPEKARNTNTSMRLYIYYSVVYK